MPPSEKPCGASRPAPGKRARTRRGARILASLISGSSIDEISDKERLSLKQVEKLLRQELQRRWVAPAQDYARLQIVRLEGMCAKLADNAENGDLASIDRILRILDRLDRYHGFSKLTPATTNDYAGAHERLMAKINRSAARFLSPPRDPS